MSLTTSVRAQFNVRRTERTDGVDPGSLWRDLGARSHAVLLALSVKGICYEKSNVVWVRMDKTCKPKFAELE